jgi:FtsP/CotA-like multicopper oxidase with cupredoxin domain
MNRRDFLKYAGGGMATLVVGGGMPWIFNNPAYAAVPVQSLSFHITDAMKEMVTHNALNDARCYFWIYRSVIPDFPAECPGPNIFATRGDTIQITLTNDLDEPHAFYIPGIFNSGPIAPRATKTFSFNASKSGTFMYYDNLNEPVNRVMGLHGMFIVMPDAPKSGHNYTPYDNPTPAIQNLFDDFGSAAHWPGLAWEQGDPATDTPAFRQYLWLCSESSPRLFAEVGNYTPGQDYPAATFVDKYLNDPYANTFKTGVFNYKAHYFTINGQSGHFSHNSPYICPNARVGEPCIIRCACAGLHTHSLHIHANHVFVLSERGQIFDNPLWVDTYTLHPLDTYDWAVPYMRPPDIPNQRGIGRADTPLISVGARVNGLDPMSPPHPVWPPTDEINIHIPPVGTLADPLNPLSPDISVQLSPLCFPMHSHSEASQTARGGNYNCGLISGINFTGDRNTPGAVTTFPNAPTMHGPFETGPCAPQPEGH